MLICFFLVVCFFCSQNSFSQDSSAFDWKVTSKKISANEYELQFSVNGANGWQLYAPNQVLSEVVTTELKFSDSSIQLVDAFNLKIPGIYKQYRVQFLKATWSGCMKMPLPGGN